jgi:hypothetical protein
MMTRGEDSGCDPVADDYPCGAYFRWDRSPAWPAEFAPVHKGRVTCTRMLRPIAAIAIFPASSSSSASIVVTRAALDAALSVSK